MDFLSPRAPPGEILPYTTVSNRLTITITITVTPTLTITLIITITECPPHPTLNDPHPPVFPQFFSLVKHARPISS